VGAMMRFFLFATMFRLALGLTQSPIQWVPAHISLGIKQMERKADCSPTSTANVKNAWAIPLLPPLCRHSMVLN